MDELQFGISNIIAHSANFPSLLLSWHTSWSSLLTTFSSQGVRQSLPVNRSTTLAPFSCFFLFQLCCILKLQWEQSIFCILFGTVPCVVWLVTGYSWATEEDMVGSQQWATSEGQISIGKKQPLWILHRAVRWESFHEQAKNFSLACILQLTLVLNYHAGMNYTRD